MKEFYLHIADPRRVKNIMKKGLKANADGVINLLDTFKMAVSAPLIKYPCFGEEADYEIKTTILIVDDIAIGKGLSKYTLLKILRDGIKTEPVQETDNTLFSEYAWRVKQPLIEPQYIIDMGSFRIRHPIANEIRRKGETDWYLIE